MAAPAINSDVKVTFIRSYDDGGTPRKVGDVVTKTPAQAAVLMRKQVISVSNTPGNTVNGNDADGPRRVERLVPAETTGDLAVEN